MSRIVLIYLFDRARIECKFAVKWCVYQFTSESDQIYFSSTPKIHLQRKEKKTKQNNEQRHQKHVYNSGHLIRKINMYWMYCTCSKWQSKELSQFSICRMHRCFICDNSSWFQLLLIHYCTHTHNCAVFQEIKNYCLCKGCLHSKAE